MTTTNEFGFDYVFDLARKLSPEEQALLAERLAAPEPDENNNKFVIVTVDTGNPIFTPEELAEFERRGQALLDGIDPVESAKRKRELRELMMKCPVMSDEDLRGIEEARKEINECRLASL